MPRVSEAHLAARREEILLAANRCFTRNGFHATSMQDVIREAGLSVGAVYRYFKSKDELIRAIAERNVGRFDEGLGALARQEPPPPLDEVMRRMLTLAEAALAPGGMANLALQVWAESLRDPALSELVRASYGRLRGTFVAVVGRARDAGHVPADVDPVELASALFSLLPGYIVQRVLTGHPARDVMAAGVDVLLTTALGASQSITRPRSADPVS